jgi:hypothetical protein
VRYIRLDDLSAVELNSWEVLWGPETKAIKVKKSHLRKITGHLQETIARGDGCVPFHSISANWAVRLVEANSLDARAARIAYLIARDGDRCFYCDLQLIFKGQYSINQCCEIEHIVPTAHGGPDHASNLCLVCPPCNRAMGALSAAEKVRLAIKMRVGTGTT